VSERIETRKFTAQDNSGKSHVVVAYRDLIIAMQSFERLGPWRFRLEDGREVLPGRAHGHYLVKQDNIALTTSDLNEPKD
jgi:hypothetical protein